MNRFYSFLAIFILLPLNLLARQSDDNKLHQDSLQRAAEIRAEVQRILYHERDSINNVLDRRAGYYAGSSVSAMIGFSGIVSDVYSLWTGRTPTNCFSWRVNYSWVSGRRLHKAQLGVGFMYAGFLSTGKGFYEFDNYRIGTKEALLHTYIAPQFIFKAQLPSERWALEWDFGIGYNIMSYRGHVQQGYPAEADLKVSDSGLAMNMGFCLEYRCSEHLRLIADFSTIVGDLSDKSEEYGLFFRQSGNVNSRVLSVINIGVGARWHF